MAPVCPPNVSSTQCTIVLTRVTALETLRDGVSYPTKVTKAGRIVAFTVGLSKLSTNKSTQKTYIHFLDQTYGGTAQVAVTVLRPVGKHTDWRWQVVGTQQRLPRDPVPRLCRAAAARVEHRGQARRRGRALDPDLGADADDQPGQQEVRLPPEPERELQQPAVLEPGAADDQRAPRGTRATTPARGWSTPRPRLRTRAEQTRSSSPFRGRQARENAAVRSRRPGSAGRRPS